MALFTFDDLLRRTAELTPEAVAVVDGDVSYNYQQVLEQVDQLAQWLISQGLERRDRVAIHLPKGIDEIVTLFAVARAGGVFVNLHPQHSAEQVVAMIEDAGARFLFVQEKRAGELAPLSLPESLEKIAVRGTCPDHPHMQPWPDLTQGQNPPEVPVIDTDLASLIYTSGSTGRPKGVMLTHQNMVHGARSVAQYLESSSDDRILSVLPLAFDYGLNQITSTFLVGGTVVLQHIGWPAEIVEALVKHKITGLAGVPPIWVGLSRYLQAEPTPLPALRYITNSGGAIPGAVLEKMPEVFSGADIYLMYGLTEAFRATYLPPSMFAKKMGAAGYPIPNVELAVINEEGLCGPGEEGELVQRGSLVAAGYWRNPSATAEKFRPCPQWADTIGEETVCYSGDLVRMDEDGCYWIIGRNDSLIKTSGFRVSPNEIEELLHRNEAVNEVVAFSVPNDFLGQEVQVAIHSTGKVEENEILRWCRMNLPTYMVPKRVFLFSEAFPRGGTGKLDRPEIVRQCALPKSASIR